MNKQRKKFKLLRIEIFSIGNELLIGHTLDTNSHWIAKHLVKLGWKLVRVTKIRDEIPEIKTAIRECFGRHPQVIITLGGLGPTYDDMTMRGLALALNRPLELNPGALQLVKEHYKKMEGGGPKLTRYRMKMATIPRGSVPIPNPVGTAPGILSYKAGTAIFSLPGVPSEMKSIFAQFILPFLKTYSSNLSSEIQLRISGVIESTLAPVLDRLRRKYSALYFKSHPQGIETKGRPVILLHIYTVEPVDRSRILAASAEIIHELSLSNTSS